MAQTFNADEILEIAEQIERNGAAFYRKAAENTALADARQMLLDLAEMEDKHERIFIGMHQELRREHPDWLSESFAIENEDEPRLYLRAVAEGKVFGVGGDPSEKLSGDETLEEVLQIALGLEKDSILYYAAMRSTVPQPTGREKIDEIILEEMRHVRMLSDELNRLAG